MTALGDLKPGSEVTFTVTSTPHHARHRKTIERLMGMQTRAQRDRALLARKRRQGDNRPYIRAGVVWVDRAKATKVVRVEAGETFTIHVTPQILPDLRNVGEFLKA